MNCRLFDSLVIYNVEHGYAWAAGLAEVITPPVNNSNTLSTTAEDTTT